MYTVAFGETTFRPRSIPDNDTRPDPVVFTLTPVARDHVARLKAFLYSAAWMTATGASVSTAELTDNAVAGIRGLAGVFADGVQRVEGLAVPALLAFKVGLTDKPSGPDVPILTGTQFDKVSQYLITLSSEVAFKLSEMNVEADLDPRFFDSPSTSPATRPGRSGSARRAKTRRGGNGTAG